MQKVNALIDINLVLLLVESCRAHKICSSQDLLNNELKKLKQIFVNNGYTNINFDHELDKFLHKTDSQQATENSNKIKIYYENLMSTAYEIDERIIRNIIDQNTRVVNNNDKLDLIIYYKNHKTAQLIMTNNTNKKTQLNTFNVIYQFTCPNEDCMLRSTNNIGSTTTTLSRRLTMHLTNGAIKEHQLARHQSNLTRDNAVDSTMILLKHSDAIRLLIHKALLIKDWDPNLNRQDTGNT